MIHVSGAVFLRARPPEARGEASVEAIVGIRQATFQDGVPSNLAVI